MVFASHREYPFIWSHLSTDVIAHILCWDAQALFDVLPLRLGDY